jgi:MarR family transcriptional regulator for hemolysin
LAGLSEDKVQIMKEVLEKVWINLQANMELSNKTPATITDKVGQKQGLRETTPSQQQV